MHPTLCKRQRNGVCERVAHLALEREVYAALIVNQLSAIDSGTLSCACDADIINSHLMYREHAAIS